MLLTALVLTCAAAAARAEWVEITQTHYNKPQPVHPNRFYPASDETTSEHTRNNFFPAHEDFDLKDKKRRPYVAIDDDDVFVTKLPERTEYRNQTITEHKWNQNQRTPGHVQRVKSEIKKFGNVTPAFSIEVVGEVTEEPAFVTATRKNHGEIVPAKIERVANKGSVKRVQLNNTPVKAPSLVNVTSTRRYDMKQHGHDSAQSDFSDELQVDADNIFNDKESFAVTHKNQAERVFSSTKETPVRKYETSTVWPVTGTPTGDNRHHQTNVDITKNVIRNKSNITKIQHSNVDQDRFIKANMNTQNIKNKPMVDKILQSEKDTTVKNTQNDKRFEEESVEIDVEETKQNSNQNKYDLNIGEQKVSQQEDKTKSNKQNTKESEEIKVNTIENILKFLKVVTETIAKNSRRGVEGKVKYLHELKDSLLHNIRARIDAVWPDEERGAARRARAAEPRGHVEFPSSESSLMTISFLTFAVFLIKLVLQVIQTYKHKTMMVAPIMVAAAGRKLRRLHDSN